MVFPVWRRGRCAGAFPNDEFFAVATVFVNHNGFEVGGLFHARFDKAADGSGVFHAVVVVVVVAFHVVFRAINGGAVVCEVLHEVGGKFVGDEFGGDAA